MPDRLRGRVFTFYDVVWQSARLASTAGGGLLADCVDIHAVYFVGGALLVAACTSRPRVVTQVTDFVAERPFRSLAGSICIPNAADAARPRLSVRQSSARRSLPTDSA